MFRQQANHRWGPVSAVPYEYCVPQDCILAPNSCLSLILHQPATPSLFLAMMPLSIVPFLILLLAKPLASDLGRISGWGSTNHVCFKPTRTSIPFVSLNHLPYSLQLNPESTFLHPNESFSLLGLCISITLCWWSFLLTFASQDANKLNFPLCSRRLFVCSFTI